MSQAIKNILHVITLGAFSTGNNKKTLWTRLAILLAAISAIMWWSELPEKIDKVICPVGECTTFRAAKATDTVESYKEFLRRYGDTKNSTFIESYLRKKRLEFVKAKLKKMPIPKLDSNEKIVKIVKPAVPKAYLELFKEDDAEALNFIYFENKKWRNTNEYIEMAHSYVADKFIRDLKSSSQDSEEFWSAYLQRINNTVTPVPKKVCERLTKEVSLYLEKNNKLSKAQVERFNDTAKLIENTILTSKNHCSM